MAIMAALSAAASTGMWLERTSIGAALTGPVSTMLVAVLASNLRVLPAPGPHYGKIQVMLAMLSTPMLLLSADIRKIVRESGTLLITFLASAVSVVLGGIVASVLLRKALLSLGADGLKVAAAIVAKNIGGGINFLAVTATLNVSPRLVATALTADNILGVMYFPFVSFWMRIVTQQVKKVTQMSHPSPFEGEVDATKVALCLCFAFTVLGVCSTAGSALLLPATSVVTVALATFFARFLSPLYSSAEFMGRLLLSYYFATAGASAGPAMFTSGLGTLSAFCAVIYIFHIGSLALFVRIRGKYAREILLGSNASIGGPATAVALAQSSSSKFLETPALLVGQFGNAIGTLVGLAFFRLMTTM